MSNNESLEELLRQSIQAQNRTTHAVRALATYTLIQIPFGGLGGIIIINAGTNTGLKLLGLIIVLIGFFAALFIALSELGKSKSYNYAPREEPSEFHFEIAKNEMSKREFWHWEDAGKPNLESWIAAGKPAYISWEKSQSTKSASE